MCNGNDKFLVFKIADIKKYMGEAAYAQLSHTAAAIASSRGKDGKTPCNQHIVINVDEPYTPEVIEILKRNGHWG